MAHDKKRPRPGPPTIGVEGELPVLHELLEIERERNIVFPETTVIIRDVERLLQKIRDREGSDSGSGSEDLIRSEDLL